MATPCRGGFFVAEWCRCLASLINVSDLGRRLLAEHIMHTTPTRYVASSNAGERVLAVLALVCTIAVVAWSTTR